MKPTIAIFLVACGLAVASAGLTQNRNPPPTQIQGGKEVNAADYPFSVGLWVTKGSEVVRRCGGVRLTAQWILTAAECVNSNKYDTVRLVAPTSGSKRYSDVKLNLATANIKVHPKYNSDKKLNNIALVKVDVLSQQDASSFPKVAHTGTTYAKAPAVVAAWLNAATGANKKEVFQMNVVDTAVVDTAECKRLHSFAIAVTDDHICASVSSRNVRLSKNDVGVPLVVKVDGKTPTLVGIGAPIKPPTMLNPLPMVFTKIAPHAEWIQRASGNEISLF